VDHAQGTVYVYGVQRAEDRKRTRITASGVERGAVGAVEHGGLAALTTPLSGEALGARDLRAHWRVLEEAFSQATVLPLRFATVMESEQAVRELLLERNAERLALMLDELDGTAQFGVKGNYDDELLLRQIVAESRPVAALRDRIQRMPDDVRSHGERVRLGQLVAGEVERRREHDAALAMSALEPVAVAARADEPRSQSAAFNLTFLVERDKQPNFDAAVARLRTALGDRVQIRYVGPSPPYSFAEADLETGSEAWA
jgi:hypothetical protein